jgi:HK97 family phage prohead protease
MLKTWTGTTELKAKGEGLFAARIATLNVVDKDNDVTIKGAFAESPTVRVSRFNHSSAIKDALPVGVATIREDGDAVIAEGKLNLSTADGKSLYDTLKFEQSHGVNSEWSYGFTVLESEDGEHDGQNVRFLQKLNPFEVSPVMRGAGQNTETIAVKNNKTATDFADLPLYDRDYRWDSSAALGRVRKWASSDGSGDVDTLDWEKYKEAFLWYDPQDDSSLQGFKLPMADITEGKLYAVPRAIFAVAAVLQGARGGVQISPEDQDHVKDTVDRYYEKMRREFEDDSIVPPWTKNHAGLSLKHEGDLVLASLDTFVERVSQLAGLRLKEDRALSDVHRKRLESMVESVASVTADIETILETNKPQEQSKPVNPLADHAAFMATLARISQE